MPIEVICQTCGKTFLTYPFYIKKGQGKYCSKKCMGEAYKKLTGEQCQFWKPKVKLTCENCGKDFEVQPYRVKGDIPAKYCSKKCADEALVGKCAGEKSRCWKPKIKFICKVCGKEFEVKPSAPGRRNVQCCSNECRVKWQIGENTSNWNGGVAFLPYCFKFNRKRKMAVRVFFNNCCIVCGKHETENTVKSGQRALPVHHVDHDKDQGCNGKPFNLVTMCSSCHMKEVSKQEEYKKYINKTLGEGFKWGVWSQERYEKEVMYSEEI